MSHYTNYGNELEMIERTQGDLRTPLDAILSQGGVAINGTGTTVQFYMRLQVASGEAEPDAKVNAAATWEDASKGHARYSFEAADVDTPGTYCYWFRVTSSGKTDVFPHDGEKRLLKIVARPKDLT